jgi:hypothetical protein
MHATTYIGPRASGMKGNLLAVLAAGFLFAACSTSGGSSAADGSAADLTIFGKVVVDDPTVGLLAVAKKASGF